MVSWATNCTELRLGGRSIGDKKAIAISEFMGDSPQLLAILLVRACHCLGRPECETHDCRGVHALQEDNRIGDKGAKSLAAALSSNRSNITRVSLFDNKIGDAGATAIATTLSQNTSVYSLNLGGNNLSDAGAMAIAEGLRDNGNLRELLLWGNAIGDRGAAAISQVLSFTNIKKLSFRGNVIGDEGAIALARAMYSHPTLKTLNLGNNQLTSIGAQAILEAVQANPSEGRTVNLYNNQVQFSSPPHLTLH